MNGVIHNCANAHKGENGEAPESEELYGAIMAYMDFLCRVVKPRRLLYVAVDGVAPRAKMNQQRSRRFRAAKEAEQAENEAIKQGKEVPPRENMWDGNCITPGTEFMDRLVDHLHFYVRKKQTEDPLWQSIKVIVSGPDVPGEGEHKIMNHIRWQKNQPDYDPAQSHCLYGLDADLIMLGLVTHEPCLCLLREIVRYGGDKGQPSREILKNPSEDGFLLFHVGLLREYLELEFKQDLPFEFDLEHVIDDWVLLAMLCGNDFLPHIPTLDIAEGALDLLSRLYRRMLPHLGGYLTEHGKVRVDRFRMFMSSLTEHEESILSRRAQDAQAVAEKRESDKGKGRVADAICQRNEEQEEEGVPEMMSAAFRAMFSEEGGGLPAWHERYYHEKLCMEVESAPWLAKEYVQGIQWVMDYYYRGVPSWKWYYPKHYAPLAKDLAQLPENFNAECDLDVGAPLRPFEQLMAVLPPRSADLLPQPLQWLMTDPGSPLADFYPRDFAVDLEGKRAEWEGIVLIPFVDEERLLQEVNDHWPWKRLSESERRRNALGKNFEFVYSAVQLKEEKRFVKSTLPTLFSNLYNCLSQAIEEQNPPPQQLPHWCRSLAANLLDGAQMKSNTLPGFPTLHTLEVEGRLEAAGVCVFNRPTQKESLIVSLEGPRAVGFDDMTAAADAIVNSKVYVKWPYLQEGEVAEIVREEGKCKGTSSGKKPLDNKESKQMQSMRNTLLRTKGVDVGDVQTALNVRLCDGKVRHQDGSIRKRFSGSPLLFPVQSAVWRCPSQAQANEVDDSATDKGNNLGRLPPGTQCLYVGKAYYGCPVEVVAEQEGTDNNVTVRVYPKKPVPPGFGNRILEGHKQRFTPSGIVARKLGIHPRALGALAGSVHLITDAEERVDVGLQLRNVQMGMCVPDYCRPTTSDDGWEYSDAAMEAFGSLARNFQWLVKAVESSVEVAMNAGVHVSTIFPNSTPEYRADRIKELVSWERRQPFAKRQLVRKTSSVAPEPAVRAFAASAPQSADLPSVLLEDVDKRLLLLPISRDVIPAVAGGEFALGDRVALATGDAEAPFGSRGTVIGVHEGMACEVLFDNEFPSGTDLGGRVNGRRGLLLPGHELINLTRIPSSASLPGEKAIHAVPNKESAEQKEKEQRHLSPKEQSFWQKLKHSKSEGHNNPEPATASPEAAPSTCQGEAVPRPQPKKEGPKVVVLGQEKSGRGREGNPAVEQAKTKLWSQLSQEDLSDSAKYWRQQFRNRGQPSARKNRHKSQR